MLSRYADLALYFWNKHVKDTNEEKMCQVAVMLPLEFTEDEFVNLKKPDTSTHTQYLNKVYKSLTQQINTTDVEVKDDVNHIQPQAQLAKATCVTLYIETKFLEQKEKMTFIKKGSLVSPNQIQSFTLTGSQIDDWNYRNHKNDNKLSRRELNKHFTYLNKNFKEPNKVVMINDEPPTYKK